MKQDFTGQLLRIKDLAVNKGNVLKKRKGKKKEMLKGDVPISSPSH